MWISENTNQQKQQKQQEMNIHSKEEPGIKYLSVSSQGRYSHQITDQPRGIVNCKAKA